MNYKELLKKYIRFLGEYEGSTFMHQLDSCTVDVKFTDEEVAELEKMDRELWG